MRLQDAFIVLSCLGMNVAFYAIEATAKVIVVRATSQATWVSGGNKSNTDGTPLVVEVKKGDLLVIDIPVSNHGIVTIDKEGTQQASNAIDLVQPCGGQDTESAVLHEVCNDEKDSGFGREFQGAMAFEVKQNFSVPVHFWCVIHTGIMWGTIKLAP